MPRQGELYFELHRGTYTSHAANKVWEGSYIFDRICIRLVFTPFPFTLVGWSQAFNRRCELLLREVELAASLALVASRSSRSSHSLLPGGRGGYVYPREVIEAIWQDMLLFQVSVTSAPDVSPA